MKDYGVGFIYSPTVLSVFNLWVLVCAIQPWWLLKHAVIDQDEHCRIRMENNTTTHRLPVDVPTQQGDGIFNRESVAGNC